MVLSGTLILNISFDKYRKLGGLYFLYGLFSMIFACVILYTCCCFHDVCMRDICMHAIACVILHAYYLHACYLHVCYCMRVIACMLLHA